MYIISQSLKCFTTLSILQALKLSYLPLDMVLTKLSIYIIFQKSLLSDSIHVTRKIFDSSSHLFQKHAAIILNNLREFFSHYQKNLIKFWKCLSQCKWNSYKIIDAETKAFNLTLLLPNKYSCDFSKKYECDNIINKWKMTFQVSDMKGRHFLELIDSNNNILEPSYSKGSTWLKHFGYSNML